MSDTSTTAPEPEGEAPPSEDVPEGVTHSHADPYHPDRFAIGETQPHPERGTVGKFTYPADNRDRKIRAEHPSFSKDEPKVIDEFVNPLAPEELDPETDDVIWDGRTGEWVPRVAASETGTGADRAS